MIVLSVDSCMEESINFIEGDTVMSAVDTVATADTVATLLASIVAIVDLTIGSSSSILERLTRLAEGEVPGEKLDFFFLGETSPDIWTTFEPGMCDVICDVGSIV